MDLTIDLDAMECSADGMMGPETGEAAVHLYTLERGLPIYHAIVHLRALPHAATPLMPVYGHRIIH